MQKEPIRLTKEEYFAKGRELYGDDFFKWKLRCPICGNIQTPEDFRQYKERGATTDSAFHNCIGRFSGGSKAFGDQQPNPPCDYTAYGLFTFCAYIAIDEEGGEHRMFPFADDPIEEKVKP